MRFTWIMILTMVWTGGSHARDLQREISLRRGWRFEIGDDIAYARPEFDDSNWIRMPVPCAWEEAGFPGYDGYAWYRIHVKIGKSLMDRSLYLKLGYIDDVDEVFLNGERIGGTGLFPPDYQSAYNDLRVYHIPKQRIRFNEVNTLAVRVYDSHNKGGIVGGPVGIYSHPLIRLSINLAGEWKFSPGDALAWADPDYDDAPWDAIRVPSKWESQGYPFHNGFGWYRKSVMLSDSLKNEKCILVLGLIDDADEVYFNGKQIGSTGAYPGQAGGYSHTQSWKEERYYLIPPPLIQWNQRNLIAVRVYDYWGQGGIYEGPVGITTQKDYLSFKKKNTSARRFIERILDEWN